MPTETGIKIETGHKLSAGGFGGRKYPMPELADTPISDNPEKDGYPSFFVERPEGSAPNGALYAAAKRVAMAKCGRDIKWVSVENHTREKHGEDGYRVYKVRELPTRKEAESKPKAS